LLISKKKIMALILAWFCLAPCGQAWSEPAGGSRDLMTVDCPKHLVLSRESLSRSGICIRLDRDHSACRIRGIVGGEHISYVGVRGPEGSKYRIAFSPVQGSPGYVVQWPERISIVSDPDSGSQIIGPLDTPGFILACYAHPFGEYTLSIRLLPGEN